MLASVHSCWVHGVEAKPVRVEVNVQPGLPLFTIVGLPAGAVRESKDRVFAALAHTGHALPPRRVTVNLAPADLPKSGSGFDLPITVGLLAALEVVPYKSLQRTAFAGELGLDGSIRPIRGAIALSMGCQSSGRARLVLPSGNVAEASAVPGIEVLGARSLPELIGFLTGKARLAPIPRIEETRPEVPPDLDAVRGQAFAKRALVVAAAGGHNLLMSGPPGAGKTMLASRLPGLLPRLTPAESLEVTRVHSVAGLLEENAAPRTVRPFRAPHHTISTGGLVGGGTPPRPGEVSLAHLGVLFLDELPEFRRGVLETLRQPMETGSVQVARVRYSVTFPARFQLIAAMNPCPCGLGGERCVCGEADIRRYLARLSGPLMDRIDLHVHVKPLAWGELMGPGGPERAVASPPPVEALELAEGHTALHADSEAARSRVASVRHVQALRNGRAGINAHLPAPQLMAICRLTSGALDLLESAVGCFQLSARAVHRVLRVARTIADLEGREPVGEDHTAEAIQLRTGLPSGVGASSKMSPEFRAY